MPRKVLLSAYTIRVSEKRKKDSFQKLDLFDGTHDLHDLFLHYLKDNLNLSSHDHDARQLLNLRKIENTGRMIEGLIRAGQYGQGCEVWNADSMAVSYTKTPKDADMLPHFFRMDMPQDRDEGVLIVEVGVKTALTDLLKRAFSEKFGAEYVLRFGGLVPKEVIENTLKKGYVHKVRFIHMGLPPDLADSYGTGHKEVHGSTEFVIKARNGSLPLAHHITKFLKSGSKNLNGFYDIEGVRDFDVHQIRVAVKIGGQSRTINLGELTGSPTHDVTSEVKFGKDGNPTFESITKAGENLSALLMSGLYVKSS